MTETETETGPGEAQPEDEDTRLVPFVFRGTANEFFKIWIVNIVLSVVTLGIYSAWAKVRTHRYFYGSTSLDGRPFEYTASPLAILKGRILAVVVFLLWYLGSTVFPLIAFVFFPLLLAAVPWVIVRSLKFRAFNTRYRNLRFHFYGTKWEAAKAYLLLPFLSLFTLGILWPYVSYTRGKFVMSNLGFGDRRSSFFGRPGGYYSIWLPLIFSMLGIAILLVILIGFGAAATELVPDDGLASLLLTVGIAVLYVLLIVAVYIFSPAYIKAQEGNYLLNHSQTAGYLPHSNMKVWELFKIYLTNVLAIIFTIGLAIPWTMIRTRRYRLDHMALEVKGDLDAILAGEQDGTSATGEELGQVFDIDIGF